jgi:uncharacterized OsmC-like protein
VSRARTEVVATSVAGYETRVTARGHEITADEPAADGGTDRGPTPTELLLAALASCYTLALRWAAARRGVDLGRVQVTAVGGYEQLRFSEIRLAIAADFPPGEEPGLLAAASRVCYVSNTLAAGVTVDVTVVAPLADG